MKYCLLIFIFISFSCSSTKVGWRNSLPEMIVFFDYSEGEYRIERIILYDYSENYLDKICSNIAFYFYEGRLSESMKHKQITILEKSIKCYFIFREEKHQEEQHVDAVRQNLMNVLFAIFEKNNNTAIASSDHQIGIFYRNCFPALLHYGGVKDMYTPFLVDHVAKSLKRNNIKIDPKDPLGQKNILIYIERPQFELTNKDKNIYEGFQYIGILDNRNGAFIDCYIHMVFSVTGKAHVFHGK